MTTLNAFGRALTSAKNTEDGVFQNGYSPELYSVANGAYTSNAAYGSFSPLLTSYLTNQISRGTSTVPIGAMGHPFAPSTTGCNYRQQGNKVEFVCSVTLGGTDPDYPDTEELRIRPAQLVQFNRVVGQRGLPLPDPKFSLPLFGDVEILNKLGVVVAPDASTAAGEYQILARLLLNGDLALVLKDGEPMSPPVIRGLQTGDIDEAFAADNIVNITIRGTYKSIGQPIDVRQRVHT
jgi:hypothetical protein